VIADDKLVLARGNRAGKLQRGAVKLPIHIDRLRRNPIHGHPIQSEAFGIPLSNEEKPHSNERCAADSIYRFLHIINSSDSRTV